MNEAERSISTRPQRARISIKTWIFIGFIAAITLFQAALGFWQWNRRAEKRDFIAAIDKAAQGAPKKLAEARLWERVEMTGRYLHDKTAYVRSSRPEPKPGERNAQGKAIPAGSFGVVVMTPFVTQVCGSDQRCTLTTIFVNRGFVPTPPNGKIPPFGRPDEPLTLIGFLRPSEKASFLQPGNDPARGVYFFRTTEEMARAAGLFGANEASPTPYTRFVDRQISTEGGEAGETEPPFGIEVKDFLKAVPNNHYEYALTWWALALTNIIIMGFFLVSRHKPESEGR